jgi:hypothetical protein
VAQIHRTISATARSQASVEITTPVDLGLMAAVGRTTASMMLTTPHQAFDESRSADVAMRERASIVERERAYVRRFVSEQTALTQTIVISGALATIAAEDNPVIAAQIAAASCLLWLLFYVQWRLYR